MRASALALLLWTVCGSGSAQNLVPNPSFEQVTSCPSFASQLDRAAPWTNPTLGTPELFHGCAPLASYVSVPYCTTGGFQHARTGQGFIGLYTWRTDIADMREYAEVELVAPLVAGTCYRVAFFVNMPNDHPYACDGIGAHFSAGPIGASNGTVLPYPAHVEHPAGTLITDTLGWTLVSGAYMASGGETHLTIGNFRNDTGTQTLQIATNVWHTTSAYLLVDDVSVEELFLSVDLGPDTLICDGASLLLDATIPGASYLWSDGGTGPTTVAGGPGTYWVRVFSGPCSASDTIVITGGTIPELDLPQRVNLCPGASLELDASSAGARVVWMDGDSVAIRTVSAPGTYTVTATNPCGSTTASVEVTYDLCPCVPYLPNAFTPNADGINDVVRPEFHCGDGALSWSIHDRWGQRVFTSAEGATCWDGMINGTLAPDGVYVWRGRVSIGAHGREYMGHFVLLR
ncbi:MAG: gliding motility-associated C-terminal domain-containing protein [Flavobacteriales bacterium]|nr:gliding motility-associated C-terminal domain-containing protein [Flavobacteriales bacterium]